jgi:hypothetical protein
MRVRILIFIAILTCCACVVGCQPSNPPPTPLPTKEKTIDKVKNDVDKAMREAREKLEAEDTTKTGY